MPRGERTVWTPEREAALLKMGQVAKKYGSERKRDWEIACEKSPKEREILRDFSIVQLRKTHTRILKSSQGLCIQEYCPNETDSNHRYCEECRAKHKKRQNRKKRSLRVRYDKTK